MMPPARILAALFLLSLPACTAEQPPPERRPSSQVAPASLAHLRSLVGKYPTEVRLWETSPLHDMQVAGPVTAEGDIIYVTGNKPHSGGAEAAAFWVEMASGRINVWLMVNEQAHSYAEAGIAGKRPAAVETLISELLPAP
ncbi:hypothetical protein HUU39_25500 [candidate division KSB1 bacterium]|nr:hypothetical protein [candidate division KSB1 bacterium]